MTGFEFELKIEGPGAYDNEKQVARAFGKAFRQAKQTAQRSGLRRIKGIMVWLSDDPEVDFLPPEVIDLDESDDEETE